MNIQQSVVAVPARLASSRLPDKVLADIGGKSMIQRVLEQCSKAKGPAHVVLCTDSSRLKELAEDWGFSVLMTSENCSSVAKELPRLLTSWLLGHGMNKLINGMKPPVFSVWPAPR